MKAPQALAVCFCLLGMTQLGVSQVKESAARTIPGYLDPATGKFSTRVAPAAQENPLAAVATPATSIFFREDFQISITNYDQPGTTAVCEVDMGSYGDSIGVSYSETASVTATQAGGGFSCDVPLLTLWTLQTPTMDSIYANVTVSIYSQTTPLPIYRSSSQSLTLTQPGNTQTVVTAVKFQI